MNKISVPNLLSISRMVVAPLVVYLVVQADWRMAAVLFWLAIGSDIADGYLARRWGQTTHFGGFLDHLSDAVLVTALLAAEAILGIIPMVLPIIVFAAFIQYTLDSNVLSGQPLRASQLGRYNGILYFVLAGFPVMQEALRLELIPVNNFVYLAYALLASTFFSMFDRLFTLIRLHRQRL